MTAAAIPGNLPGCELICELCSERFKSEDPEAWICPGCWDDLLQGAMDYELAARGLYP